MPLSVLSIFWRYSLYLLQDVVCSVSRQTVVIVIFYEIYLSMLKFNLIKTTIFTVSWAKLLADVGKLANFYHLVTPLQFSSVLWLLRYIYSLNERKH